MRSDRDESRLKLGEAALFSLNRAAELLPMQDSLSMLLAQPAAESPRKQRRMRVRLLARIARPSVSGFQAFWLSTGRRQGQAQTCLEQ